MGVSLACVFEAALVTIVLNVAYNLEGVYVDKELCCVAVKAGTVRGVVPFSGYVNLVIVIAYK